MAVPQFTKSPPELVERFDAAAARHPAAVRRKMFGYPALFVGGNLATGLFADTWMVRLAPADLEALIALPGAGPFAPMPGRTMKGYATLPPGRGRPGRRAGRLARARDHVRREPARQEVMPIGTPRASGGSPYGAGSRILRRRPIVGRYQYGTLDPPPRLTPRPIGETVASSRSGST